MCHNLHNQNWTPADQANLEQRMAAAERRVAAIQDKVLAAAQRKSNAIRILREATEVVEAVWMPDEMLVASN